MGLIAGTPDWLRKPRAISREAATMGRCISDLNEVVAEPSSTIPEGSRAKRSEMPHILGSNKDDDIVRSA